ncbi:ribokinase [Rhizobium lentis]|uniref:ribokinase n=1 Tax=Rhizobium lentis TaxID=1138194 RepID=UPI001C836070|nr:ribokinase [Rhizobium lentis]MBX5041244.1 ribokinase [Rhizobium lentis]MBX5071501.1 ribokinase [Rhizobium lentis]MBX5108461.1 ribokinase [Rhizobium lentis]MBX5117859.1 ribokinase [Rhizobium lentis]MBX5141389.1 ribokinase [Rhizobium lentis]
MTIHVVGNVCVDSSFRLERLPQSGETLNATTAGEGLGGKGANQAVAAARTGASVTLWAPLGRDAAGDGMESLLSSEISDLRLSRLDLPSDRSVILIDRHGENVIITAAACAEAFNPLTMCPLASTWSAGDMLLMQGNLGADVTVQCLEAARRAGLFTVLNPSPLASDAPDLSAVSLLIINRPEAEALTGETSADRAADRLRARGAATLIVTLGSEGALVLDASSRLHIPAEKREAVDASGAGDCFAGTLAGLLAQRATLADAARLATRAAGIAVGRAGTLASFPTSAELAALTKTLKLENV